MTGVTSRWLLGVTGLILAGAALGSVGLFLARQPAGVATPAAEEYARREESEAMERYIIRRIRTAHCKRGPSRCETCREMNVERICLLDIAPPDAGLVQRRVTEVEVDGETTWREFDVVTVFSTEEDAREYAEQHSISDVEL